MAQRPRIKGHTVFESGVIAHAQDLLLNSTTTIRYENYTSFTVVVSLIPDETEYVMVTVAIGSRTPRTSSWPLAARDDGGADEAFGLMRDDAEVVGFLLGRLTFAVSLLRSTGREPVALTKDQSGEAA